VRAKQFSGFDWGVVYGSSARIWSMFTGAITVILIATYFSPSVQGFYYTFLSLTAVQVFFELGLTQVVIQFAAHEWANLNFTATGHIEGNPAALSRLASLARFVNKWFAVASVLFFAGIVGAGWFAFYDTKVQIAWQWPWISLCVVVAIDLSTLPLWSLLEGCNQIKSIYGLRFLRAVLNSIVAWAAISQGAGLWALPISMGISLSIVTGVLFYRHGRFFESLLLLKLSGDNVIGWRHELWPMQWRIAVTWLSGYMAELDWCSDWFANFVVAFREGFAYVPQTLAVMRTNASTLSAVGMSSWRRRRPVLLALAYLLNDRYSDVRPAFIESGVLSQFGQDMLRLALQSREALVLLRPRDLGLGIKRALVQAGIGRLIPEQVRMRRKAQVNLRVDRITSRLNP
jgi:hypothetical protein